MKTITVLLLMIAVTLLLSACTQGSDNTKESTSLTGQVTGSTQTIEDSPRPVVREFEVRLERNFEDGGADRWQSEGDGSKEEVNGNDESKDKIRLAVEEENFFPQTFVANKGDVVRLVFFFDEPKFVSIDELGVAENVENSVVEFVAEEPGIYNLICWDCVDQVPAELIIN